MPLFPAGFTPYGGATISGYTDATGVEFWSCTGRFPPTRFEGLFGQAVFKVQNGVSSYVDSIPFVSGRGSLCLSYTGLYLYVFNDATPLRFAIPEFKTASIGVPTLAVDQVARDYLASLGAITSDIAEQLETKINAEDAGNIAAGVLANWWRNSVAYAAGFKPLYNVIWNRGVKQMEFMGLIPKGKYPINEEIV